MKHKDVHVMFTRLFPMYSAGEYTWYSSGKNTIRIKILEDMIFVFTFNNKTWSFETDKSYDKFRIPQGR